MSRTLQTLGLLVFVTPMISCTRTSRDYSAPQTQSQSETQSQTRPIVAKIAGQPIYDDEIVPFAETELKDLRRQEYNIRMKALSQAIDNRLLTSEAEKKKVAVDALLKTEADAKVTDPSDSEIQSYYETQKDALKVPL